MRRNLIRSVIWTTSVILLSASFIRADATPLDWVGHWDINSDGQVGHLYIRRNLSGIVVSYQAKGDSATTWRTAENPKFDDKNQHLNFKVDFNNYHQPFDLYIFSWDKKKFAGTTVWGNRTFGVSGEWVSAAGKDDGGE